MFMLVIIDFLDSPEGWISVEMADNILGVFHLAEKVFLTGYFPVLTVTFGQPLLKSKITDLKYVEFNENKDSL